MTVNSFDYHISLYYKYASSLCKPVNPLTLHIYMPVRHISFAVFIELFELIFVINRSVS